MYFHMYAECSNNMYGPACLTPCHCDQTCNPVNGVCPGQCNPGRHGDSCQKGEVQFLNVQS